MKRAHINLSTVVICILILLSVSCINRGSNSSVCLSGATANMDINISTDSLRVLPERAVLKSISDNKRSTKPKAIDSTVLIANRGITFTYNISPDSPSIAQRQGISLLIDSGSVSKTTHISISPIDSEELPLLPSNMVNVTDYSGGFRCLPDGQKFTKEIVIAIAYNETDIPFGYSAKDIYTYFYNNSNHRWEQIERDSVDETNRVIYSRTDHFTDYINGILKTPESSDAIAYTPTSIKDLKAADPVGAYTIISPPEANNDGSASMKYPIGVPAGRRGIQPTLNLSYNSNGGSSWVGLGWDLSVSYISVDTRHGVPIYSQELESETYLLDGQILVTEDTRQNQFRLNKPAYRRNFDNRYADGKRFYPRVEGSFNRIVRHGTLPHNYWWEVTDKNGTKYYYGSLGNGMDAAAVFQSNVSAGGKQNVSKWYLRKVEDTYGNTMIYKYRRFSDDDQQVVLESILYTGDKESDGKYCVSFKVSDKGKPDKSFSYRSGFKESDAKLLDKITVSYSDTIIKEYYFGYKTGIFGKTLLCSVIESFEDSVKYQKYDMIDTITWRIKTPNTNILLQDIFNRCDFAVKYDTYMFLHVLYSFEYNEVHGAIFEEDSHTINYKEVTSDNLGYAIIPIKENENFSASRSFSYDLGGGVDFGLFSKIWSKSLSVGGNYMHNKEDSEGVVSFVDLNGDGYPDKLIRYNENLYYRLRNVESYDSQISFGPLQYVGSSLNFLKSNSTTNSWGIEGQAKIFGKGGDFAHTWSTTTGATSNYLSDVNGDGLADIVDNGKTFINEYYRRGKVSFADVTEEDTVFVGGYCGGEYIRNDGEVDSSIFESGWRYYNREICEKHIVGEPMLVNESIFTGYRVETHITDSILDSVCVSTELDSVKVVSVILNDTVLLDIKKDTNIGNNSNYIIENVTSTFLPGGNCCKFKNTSTGVCDAIKIYTILIKKKCYDPQTKNFYDCSKRIIVRDTIRIVAGADGYCISIPSDDYYSGDCMTKCLLKDTFYTYEKFYRCTKYEYNYRYIYSYDTIPTYRDTSYYRTWTLTDSCYTVTDSFYYEKPKTYEPNIDLVRMWQAPYHGVVKISGVARLSEDLDSVRIMANVRDGVGLSIQKGSELFLRKFRVVRPDKNNEDMGVDTITVRTGDRIYFRMNSMDVRAYDKVRWNPTVSYIRAKNRDFSQVSSDMLKSVDANGNPQFTFDYSNDFFVNGLQQVAAPFDCRFKIDIDVKSAKSLQDTLVLTIYKSYSVKDSSAAGEYVRPTDYTYILKQIEIPKGEEPENYSISINEDMHNSSVFAFTYQSNGAWIKAFVENEKIHIGLTTKKRRSQIRWTDIDARAKITVVESYDNKYHNSDLYDESTDTYKLVYRPVVKKQNYDYAYIPTKAWKTRNKVKNANSIVIYTLLDYYLNNAILFDMDNFIRKYPLTLTIRDRDGMVIASTTTYNRKYEVFNNIVLNPNQQYYVDYHSSTPYGNYIKKITSSIYVNNEYMGDINSGLYLDYPEEYYGNYGEMYRGWGQFGYKYNTPADTIIREEFLRQMVMGKELTADTDTSTFLPESIPDLENFPSDAVNSPEVTGGRIYNPLKGRFFTMSPDSTATTWVGYGNVFYADRQYIGHNNVNDKDSVYVDRTASPMPVRSVKEKIKAPNKNTINRGRSWTAGLTLGVSSIRETHSKGSSRVLSDFMDMNGDGYPDVLSESTIQYSKPQGGLSRYTTSFGEGINSSEYDLDGEGAGASFVSVKTIISNNLKKAASTTKGEGSISGSGSVGCSTTNSTMIDINGDGLPDQVLKGGTVRFNKGYGFTESQNWEWIGGSFILLKSRTSSRALNGGTDYKIIEKTIGKKIDRKNELSTSISFGLGASWADDTTDYSLTDINGDGLVDYFKKYDKEVVFNTGNKFGYIGYNSPLEIPSIEKSTGVTVNGSAAITFGFTALWFKILANPQGGLAWNRNETDIQLIDMNNDGYPDYVFRDGDGIKVRYSTLGTANLLKNVRTVLGSEYTIDYKLSKPNSCKGTKRTWNMSQLMVFDGYEGFWRKRYGPPEDISKNGNGTDTIRYTFEYGGKIYDRLEREDYGYDTVVTKEYLDGNVYRINTKVYYNDSYTMRGVMKQSFLTDAQGNKYIENRYEYRPAEITTGKYIETNTPISCVGDGYPALYKERTLYYEGQPEAGIVTEKEYKYGEFGNITEYYNRGSLASSDDDVKATMTYSFNRAKYIVSMVKDVAVTNAAGKLLRKRSADYDDKGSVSRLTLFVENENNSIYDYEYDRYGNISRATMPENDNGQRMQIAYRYDKRVHSYPVRTTNSFGYSSSAQYDYRWGVPLLTVDIAGNRMEYTYDTRGRLKTVRSPKEIAANVPYTIKHTYWDEQKYRFEYIKSYARYIQVSEQTNNNLGYMFLETKSYLPNLVRGLFANTYHYDSDHKGNEIVTRTFADGLGRVMRVVTDAEIDEKKVPIASTRNIYDGLQRVVRQYQPAELKISYPSDTLLFSSLDTKKAFYSTTDYDILDRPTHIVNADGTVVRYSYGIDAPFFRTDITDPNGITTISLTDHRQLQQIAVDGLEQVTFFRYDALGQLIETIDPENNKTIHVYDMLGRRTERRHPSSGTTRWKYDPVGNITRQTLNSGESITYRYEYNRPIEVHYSDRPWNDVYYRYGSYGKHTGRLIAQQDASGIKNFYYGNMGELVTQRQTYFTYNSPHPFTLTTLWEYDSWGRIKRIIYPDDEIVSYRYNKVGQLNSVKSNKRGVTKDYISDIEYNIFGQRTMVKKGNGIITSYKYNDKNQRLERLYDTRRYSNDLSLNFSDINYSYDAAGNVDSKSMLSSIARYSQFYKYDKNYRLIASEGSGMGSNFAPGYKLQMEYSPAGRILKKYLTGQKGDNNGQHILDYDNRYFYNSPSDNPYAVDLIQNQRGGEEYFEWDKKGNMITHYEEINDNARHFSWTEDNRLEAVLDKNMGAFYSYDAAGERHYKLTGATISVSQNGNSVNAPVLDQQTLYASPLITITDKGYTKHYFEEGNRICSSIGSGGFSNIFQHTSPIVSDLKEINRKTNQNAINTYKNNIGVTPYIDVTSIYPYIFYHRSTLYKSAPEAVFYYHTDHLGSATLVTDDAADVVQQIAYLPYGEDWVDIRSNGYFGSAYKFNGKEKDDETGYSYYGARYYTDRLSIWLSVDPLADKYPHLSPYAYCADNPVKYIDPDGKKIRFAKGSSNKFKQAFKQAVNYMNQKGTAGILYNLEKHPQIVYLKEDTEGKNRFDSKTNTIHWDPTQGLETTNGSMLSPATLLNHEADHAYQELTQPIQKAIDRNNTTDKKYTNAEEKRVIQGSEQITARKHGEIQEGQVTRTDHYGNHFDAKSTISNEPSPDRLSESIIIYDKSTKETILKTSDK